MNLGLSVHLLFLDIRNTLVYCGVPMLCPELLYHDVYMPVTKRRFKYSMFPTKNHRHRQQRVMCGSTGQASVPERSSCYMSMFTECSRQNRSTCFSRLLFLLVIIHSVPAPQTFGRISFVSHGGIVIRERNNVLLPFMK